MSWKCYYNESKEENHVHYEMKCPPNNSVSETWITYTIENDGAKVTFQEYDFYDKDPDGVREAYDCMYDSVHTETLTAEKFDSEKLHLYMVKTDNTVFQYEQESHCQDAIQINLQDVKAVFVFLNSKDNLLDTLVSTANKIISTKPSYNETLLIINTALQSNTENYLALFNT